MLPYLMGVLGVLCLLGSFWISSMATSEQELLFRPITVYQFGALGQNGHRMKAYDHQPFAINPQGRSHKDKFAKEKMKQEKRKEKTRKKKEKKRKHGVSHGGWGWGWNDAPKVSCWDWGLEVHDDYEEMSHKEAKAHKKRIKKLRKKCKKGWKKKEKRRFKQYKKKIKKGSRHPCGEEGCYHGYEDGWNGWKWWRPDHKTFDHGHYGWGGASSSKDPEWDWRK